MTYDSKKDTLKHIYKVRLFLNSVTRQLKDRAQYHDASKLESPEKEAFDEWTPKLSNVTYSSEEYRNMLRQMKPAIDHHQKHNRHHPEYFGDCGIACMNLIDLTEMLCDWKAATMRHNDGDIIRSLKINAKRFNMPPILVSLLENTISYMKW